METVTKNGITYTPVDDNAALTYDDSENVTGISAGTVEVTLEGKTDPKITLDGSTPFSFVTEVIDDDGLKFSQNNNSFAYVSGEATYSANEIYFPEGELKLKLTNGIAAQLLGNLNLTVPEGGVTIPVDSSGVVNFNLDKELVATLNGEAASGTLSLKGGITYDTNNNQTTFAKDAVLSAKDLSLIGGSALNFSLTALADSTLAVNDLNFVIKDGVSLQVEGNTFGLSGNLTLSGGDLSFSMLQLLSGEVSEFSLTEGATLNVEIAGLSPVSITAPASATADISIKDGVISVTASDDNGVNVAVGDSAAFTLNIKGTFKLDNANQTITLTEGTVIKNDSENGVDLTITSNSDASGTIAFNPEGGLTITPATKDALKVHMEFGDNRYLTANSIEGTINLRDGTFIFTDGVEFSGVWNITGEEEETFNLNVSGGTVTLKGTKDALTFTANEGATFVNDFGENETFTISNGSVSVTTDGTFTSTISAGTVVKDTNSQYPYVLEKAGTYSLNGNEITTTEDGVEVSLTNGDTITFDAGAGISIFGIPIEGSGNISYNGSTGYISLAEGTVMTNVFEDDGITRTITANAAAENVIQVSEDSFTIANTDPDTLTIALTNTENFEVMTISAIEGTLNYSNDNVMTFNDGTSLTISIYDFNAKFSNAGGISTVEFEDERTTYTTGEGAKFTMDYLDGTVSTLQNGSIIDTYEDYTLTLTEGSTFTSNDTNVNYRLETSGTYTLNGNEITTTEDGVEVSLTNKNTVSFDAGAGVTYGDKTFDGEGTIQITNGEISLVMTEKGSATFDGKTFELTENVADGVTITAADEGFKVATPITSGNEAGKTFTENCKVTGDDSYTVVIANGGIKELQGISGGSKITATAELEGYSSAYALVLLNIVTESEGKFTFNDKTYTVTGDDTVTLETGFLNNGMVATLRGVEDLSGEISGDFNGTTSINSSEITISKGADNATITADESVKLISGVEDGASVYLDKNTAIQAQESMTVNDVDYNVTNDSDGVTISDKEVLGLGNKSSLTVSEAGNYTVNSTPLKVAEDDIIIGVSENYAYIYDESKLQISKDETTEEILEDLGITEDEAKIIPADTEEEQQVRLKNGGDVAIVEETEAPVTLVSGNGADTIISKGDDVTVDMRKGGADKIMPLEGTVKLENYNPIKNAAGIKFSADDYKDGMTFDGDKVNLENSTVEFDGNILNYYDLDDEKGKIGFAKSTDKVVDLSTSKEDAVLAADGVYYEKGGISGASLLGGKGNDTIYGGENSYIAPGKGDNLVEMSDLGGSTLDYTSGNATVNNFNFVGSDTPADTIKTGANEINVGVEDGAVVLKTKKGDVTISDALNKDIEFNNDYTKGTIVMQVGDDALNYDGVASLFWAGGKNATVSVPATDTVDGDNGETELENIVIDLTNKDYNDTSKASFYGDIKEINAGNFEGTTELTGNDKNNVITASQGGSTLNGGDGNNSLKGGAGADEFISASGNNTISNFEFGAGTDDEVADKLNIGDEAITKVKVSGNDILLNADNGGSTKIENAVGKVMQFQSEHTKDAPILVQFDDDEVAVNDDANFYWAGGKNAVVSFADYTGDSLGVDLTNADFNNAEKLSFYGDIKEINANDFNDEAELIGNDKNNIITASRGGSTLNGGAGNDSLVGGAGVDEFISATGNDTISNFEFGTDDEADKLNSGAQAIQDVNVSGGDVILKTEDGSIRIKNASGETIKFQSEHTNNQEIYAQFGKDEVSVNEDADFYWAGGKDATVSLADYTGDSINVDLSNADFNDASKLSFYGDIKTIDATGYVRDAVLTGSTNDNVITAGGGTTTLWGGDSTSNDTLIGGDGDDTFIYGKNNGNDIVRGADENDVVKLDSITLDDLTAIGNNLFVGNDIKFDLKDGGSLTVKDAKTSGVTFDVAGTKYAVNKDSGEWEFK